MVAPHGHPRFRRYRPSRPSLRVPLLALSVVIFAALAGWYLWSRPRLVFTNTLAGPVLLAVGEEDPIRVAPGASVRQIVSLGRSLVVEWSLVRPLAADDRPMGEEVRGSLVVPKPKGTLHQSAAPRGPGGDFFAPLITNATEDLLRVTVNAGLMGAMDCGCGVRPGTRRVFIGYYRLYQNSTVRAGTNDGRTATFRDLGPNVTAKDGTVGLRFETKDLRRQLSDGDASGASP